MSREDRIINNEIGLLIILLMACRFGTGYEIDNGFLGHYYVMDDEDYAEFKKYFAVNLEKDYDFNGKKYYLAFGVGDGYGARQHYFFLKIINVTYKDAENFCYPITIYDFKKINGMYIYGINL